MKQLALAVAAILLSLPAPSALAEPSEGMILLCDFDPVEEVGEPARHVEVRPGPWDQALDVWDVFEDGDQVYLWVEEGVPARPIWPAPFNPATGGLTFQHWGYGGVTNILTFEAQDGRAVLSTHAPRGEPPRTVAFATQGTCVMAEGE